MLVFGLALLGPSDSAGRSCAVEAHSVGRTCSVLTAGTARTVGCSKVMVSTIASPKQINQMVLEMSTPIGYPLQHRFRHFNRSIRPVQVSSAVALAHAISSTNVVFDYQCVLLTGRAFRKRQVVEVQNLIGFRRMESWPVWTRDDTITHDQTV